MLPLTPQGLAFWCVHSGAAGSVVVHQWCTPPLLHCDPGTHKAADAGAACCHYAARWEAVLMLWLWRWLLVRALALPVPWPAWPR